jgi:hypothetical protein
MTLVNLKRNPSSTTLASAEGIGITCCLDSRLEGGLFTPEVL